MRAGIKIFVVLLLLLSFYKVFSAETHNVLNGEMTLVLRPDLPGGETILDLGLIGSVHFKTHKLPVNLHTHFSLHDNALSDYLVVDDSGTLSKQAERIFRDFIFRKLVWFIFFLTSLICILFSFTKKVLFSASMISIFLSFTLLGISLSTFKSSSLNSARYSGPVDKFSEATSQIAKLQQNWPTVERKIGMLLASVKDLNDAIEQKTETSVKPKVRFLVVSDIHMSAVASKIEKKAKEMFGPIDAVLDLGDLTTEGYREEAFIATSLFESTIPRYFVPGNHEAPRAMEVFRREPNFFVFEKNSESYTVGGITILAHEDPYSAKRISQTGTDEHHELLEEACRLLQTSFNSIGPRIVAAHNPKQLSCLTNIPPGTIILSGHTHRQELKEENGAIYLNPGTTGGNGFHKNVDFSFAVLEIFESGSVTIKTVSFASLDSKPTGTIVSFHQKTSPD